MIEHYMRYRDDVPPVRVEVDLSLAEEEMRFTKPLLLWVFVRMQSPNDAGLCSGEECERLLRLRDALIASLKEKLGARFSGSRMSEGWYELYFYARSGKKLIAAAGEAIGTFPGYTFDTGSSRDEAWHHYENELYPDTLTQHQIYNRHIVEELVEAGDDVMLPREVEHYLFFRLPAQRQRTEMRLEELGYVAREAVEQGGEYCYGSVVTRVQPVDEATMMHTVTELLETVALEYGRYEGWSTTLASETAR